MLYSIIIPIPNLTNGHLIIQDSDGATRHDYLYRISLKALIYNDAEQISMQKD